MPPKKFARRNTASPLTGPIAATLDGSHHRALEIAQSEAAERKSLAAIITLQKFFIDLFAVFVNNLPVKDVHLREKRWNRVMAVK